MFWKPELFVTYYQQHHNKMHQLCHLGGTLTEHIYQKSKGIYTYLSVHVCPPACPLPLFGDS